jgi:hypothetical protein
VGRKNKTPVVITRKDKKLKKTGHLLAFALTGGASSVYTAGRAAANAGYNARTRQLQSEAAEAEAEPGSGFTDADHDRARRAGEEAMRKLQAQAETAGPEPAPPAPETTPGPAVSGLRGAASRAAVRLGTGPVTPGEPPAPPAIRGYTLAGIRHGDEGTPGACPRCHPHWRRDQARPAAHRDGAQVVSRRPGLGVRPGRRLPAPAPGCRAGNRARVGR